MALTCPASSVCTPGVAERLEALEASLARLHAKVDRLVQHEQWVSRMRRRLDQYKLVQDAEDPADVLALLGHLVLMHTSSSSLPAPPSPRAAADLP